MISWKRWAVASFCSLAACDPDGANGPSGPSISVCHVEGTAGTITPVLLSNLSDHKAHGDYVTELEVDRLAAPGDSIHFSRVTDAVAAARAGRILRSELTRAACRISILVAPGILKGTANESTDPTLERFPIVIDVPDITLQGSVKMQIDAKGRATGVALAGDVTTFAPTPALIVVGGATSQQGVSQEIIVVNGHPNGSRGDGAVIEGFVFQTGRTAGDNTTGGQGVLSMRVGGVIIRGNRFEGGFTEAIDLRASSGTIERNFLTGRGDACDICISGPGSYIVRHNRLDGPGGIPGIFSTPVTILPVPTFVEQQVQPDTSTITAVITNNEVRGHQAVPVGTGIRIGALGIGAPNVVGTSIATITDNDLVGNRFGIIIEAAFPVASGSLRGDIDVTTSGNVMSQICQNNVLVSFSRHTTGLGLNTTQPYLRNTTYSLKLGSDVPWDGVWYAHPSGFGNELLVNHAEMPNGTKNSYDASRTCI